MIKMVGALANRLRDLVREPLFIPEKAEDGKVTWVKITHTQLAARKARSQQ